MIAIAKDSPPRKKTCSNCRATLPIEQFRLRVKGSEQRHSCCNPCARELERVRRSKCRLAALNEFSTCLLSKKTTPGMADKVCAAMVQRFGGLDAFCHFGHQAMQRAGPKDQLRFFLALMRLTELADQREQPDVSQLSDEDLQAELELLAVELGFLTDRSE